MTELLKYELIAAVVIYNRAYKILTLAIISHGALPILNELLATERVRRIKVIVFSFIPFGKITRLQLILPIPLSQRQL